MEEAGIQRREFRQVIVPINNAADPPPPVLSPSPSHPFSFLYSGLSWTLIFSLLKEYNKPRSVSYLVRTYRTIARGRYCITRFPSLPSSLPDDRDALVPSDYNLAIETPLSDFTDECVRILMYLFVSFFFFFFIRVLLRVSFRKELSMITNALIHHPI